MFAFKSDSIASTLNPISIPVNVIYKKDVFFEGGQMEPYILHLNAPPPTKNSPFANQLWVTFFLFGLWSRSNLINMQKWPKISTWFKPQWTQSAFDFAVTTSAPVKTRPSDWETVEKMLKMERNFCLTLKCKPDKNEFVKSCRSFCGETHLRSTTFIQEWFWSCGCSFETTINWERWRGRAVVLKPVQ